ncbi:hypothetical protein X777_14402 [Ooceraea biroi]|uniref:Uncharacterized protein n=2 Tax=Ooceraea biroi TaxID=2015173 RepID=A0A026VXF9_OOCBI|nr:hypothetical protein X777_14402 [Ooceraea biroi]
MKEVEEIKVKFQQAKMIINKLNKSKILLVKHVKRLTYNNRKLKEENNQLKNIKNCSKILNADQIEALYKQSKRGSKWFNATIRKALKLKLSCGRNGYQEILAQGIPLPALRTLRRRCEGLDFQPGICE